MSLLLKGQQDNCLYGLWHIEESAETLASMLPHAIDCPLKAAGRRQEFYAVRALLCQLGFDPRRLAHHPSGRPFLEDSDWHLSLSHCREYAAVVLSRERRHIGVDVEAVSERIRKVERKFLQPGESHSLNALAADKSARIQLLTACWTGKEALYKALCDEVNGYLQDLSITPPASGAEFPATGRYGDKTFSLTYHSLPGHLLCLCLGED